MATLDDQSVTWCRNASNASSVTDGVITTPKLGDGAATSAKIADGAVTAGKLAPDVRTNPPGTVLAYAGTGEPRGYLLCNGQAVSRTTFAALFAVIGTTYGAGDGATTFTLPNLQGRVPLGAGQGRQQDGVLLANRALAETGGAETVKLKASQSGVPAHTHPYGGGTNDFRQSMGVVTSATPGTFVPGTGSVANVGSIGSNAPADASAAHENMPPYLVVNYLIAY